MGTARHQCQPDLDIHVLGKEVADCLFASLLRFLILLLNNLLIYRNTPVGIGHICVGKVFMQILFDHPLGKLIYDRQKTLINNSSVADSARIIKFRLEHARRWRS